MCSSQPMSSQVSSNITRGAGIDQEVEGMADRRIDGDAAEAVRAAAFGADHEIGEGERHGRRALDCGELCLDPGAALLDGRARAAASPG